MTQKTVFGHGPVERQTGDGFDADLWYRCEECGLQGTEIQEFERYGCDSRPPEPDSPEEAEARAEMIAERKLDERRERHFDRHGHFGPGHDPGPD